MKQKSVISAKNICVGYSKTIGRNELILHKDLSFDLYSGELTCLLGANGIGKSTLLRTITRLQPTLSGTIRINDKDIKNYSEKELSKLIGLVLTDKSSSGGFTTKEVVSLGRYPYTNFWGNLSSRDEYVVNKAMESVGIKHKSESHIAELSDGERQKVMIAKALAQECPIIILDEPTAFLDIINRIEIMSLLHSIAKTQNKAILLSSHDIENVLSLSDKLWILGFDSGMTCGTTEDLVLSDTVTKMIGNKDIKFDKRSGNFLSTVKIDNTKEVTLIAEDELFSWGKIFLHRHGYRLTEDANLKIEIKTAGRIVINGTKVDSFEALNKHLKQL